MTRRIVVVVEDEPLVRLGATELFRDQGIEVAEFSTGDDAVDYVRHRRREIAAVFTDIYLPGEMDGLELAGIVAQACPEIAVLVTSGKNAARPGELLPQVRYVAKPWLPVDVLSAMKDALHAAAFAANPLSPAA